MYIIAPLLVLSDGTFKQHHITHDAIAVVANTVGPYNNPTETYAYYSLPFCSGTGRQKRHKQDLGETLSGSRKVHTPYEITFLDPVPWRSLCEEYLDAAGIKEFKDAVEGLLIYIYIYIYICIYERMFILFYLFEGANISIPVPVLLTLVYQYSIFDYI